MTVDKNIVTNVLDITLKSGAQNARITLNKGIQNSVIVLDNKLDQLHHAADLSLYIQLFINERYGAFSTNRIKYDEVESFIKKGIQATLLLEPDPFRVLPEKELYYKGGKKDLHQFDPEIENITTEDRKKITFECSREIFGTSSKLLTAETEFGDMIDYTYMMDSNGFEGEMLQSSYTVSTNCSVKGSGNSRPESWWYESSMFLDKLKVKGCAKTALERAIKSINPKKLISGKYTMVLENTISAKVVAPIISALNGSSIQQNNSFLIDKLGKKMFPENMNLCDEP
ncbi:MAG: metallopeptidase TldD-related protein, partial [Bacteroidales bacterium]